ncbi:MAG: POTRA domain-containing protein, partial [Pseudomonadota bacterium]
MHHSHKSPVLRRNGIIRAVCVFVICLMIPVAVQGENKRTIAVLPFSIHAPQPLDHLKQGLQEMFTVRMTHYGYAVIQPNEVNRHPLAFKPLLEKEDILAIGKALKADLVMTGSLTQIGKRISLDLKAMDVEGIKAPFSVFMVEDDIDKLADAADKAAKSLHNLIAGVEQIESIGFKGNRRIESEAILAVVESKKGDSLDNDRLDQDLRAVYRMGFFTDVNVETEDGPKGKIVIFSVTEKPSIRTITFNGNKKVKSDDLKKEAGIKIYSILNHSEIKQSINRMREYYRQKGYYNVKISELIEELPQNEVALTYEIEEGKKIYITKIKFVGNTKFKAGKLEDQMETSKKGIFSFISGSGILDKKQLELDLLKITSFYHNRGYIRAKTGDPKITYEEAGGLTITVEIIEGDQYAVNNVKIEGDLIKPVDELLKKIGINKEKFINREMVRRDTMVLREAYADEGYAYAEVAP